MLWNHLFLKHLQLLNMAYQYLKRRVQFPAFSSPNYFINVLVIYLIRIAVFLLVGDNSVIKLPMLCINGVALICFCAYYCKFPSTSSSIFIDFVLYNKVH